MDESLLPPPAKAARPFPWLMLAVLFVPAAALAAGSGLQQWLEGPEPAGDAILRWLFWSSGAGVVTGAAVGLLRRARLWWTAYGAAAPWVVAALVAGSSRAALPVREYVADRREAACREEGRRLCTRREFEVACARRDGALLGEPEQSSGSVRRWSYRGPFRPEEMPFRGAVICSVSGSRGFTMAVADP